METELSKMVQDIFGALMQKYDFKLTYSTHDAVNFGNAVAVLESKYFLIRIVRDKGQFFIDLSSPYDPNNWHQLEKLIEIMGMPTPDLVRSDASSVLNNAVYCINGNFDDISNSLGADYKITRNEINKRAIARILNTKA